MVLTPRITFVEEVILVLFRRRSPSSEPRRIVTVPGSSGKYGLGCGFVKSAGSTPAAAPAAPDAELAIHYAREMYGRRQESVRLWVVRRADILDLEDPDLLQPPLDRSFKKPGGYVMREKLAAAREAK